MTKYIMETFKGRLQLFILTSFFSFCVFLTPLNIYGWSTLRGLFFNHWGHTSGTIIDSKIEFMSSYARGASGYVVIQVKYEYNVNGKFYQSDRSNFSFANNFNNLRFYPFDYEFPKCQDATDYQNRYCKVGTVVKVYYDLNDPQNAVLNLGVNWPDFVMIFFMFGGAVVFFFYV